MCYKKQLNQNLTNQKSPAVQYSKSASLCPQNPVKLHAVEFLLDLIFTYGYLTWEWRKGIRGYTYPAMFAAVHKLLSLIKLDFGPVLVSSFIFYQIADEFILHVTDDVSRCSLL